MFPLLDCIHAYHLVLFYFIFYLLPHAISFFSSPHRLTNIFHVICQLAIFSEYALECSVHVAIYKIVCSDKNVYIKIPAGVVRVNFLLRIDKNQGKMLQFHEHQQHKKLVTGKLLKLSLTILKYLSSFLVKIL